MTSYQAHSIDVAAQIHAHDPAIAQVIVCEIRNALTPLQALVDEAADRDRLGVMHGELTDARAAIARLRAFCRAMGNTPAVLDDAATSALGAAFADELAVSLATTSRQQRIGHPLIELGRADAMRAQYFERWQNGPPYAESAERRAEWGAYADRHDAAVRVLVAIGVEMVKGRGE